MIGGLSIESNDFIYKRPTEIKRSAQSFILFSTQILSRCNRRKRVTKLNKYARQKRDFVNR